MAIPSRAQWVSLKKRYKVKDGAAKGVNMGQLLQDYDNAHSAHGNLGAVKELTALTTGAKKYHEDIKAKMPQFASVFKSDVLDEALSLGQVLEKLANPAHSFAESLRKCLDALAHLGDNPARNDLDTFVSEKVRSVGVGLGRLAQIDAKAAELKHMWDPLDVIDTSNPPHAAQILKAAIPLVAKHAAAYHLLS